ncbi:MAG TPA: DUF4132 domain-containing protein [Ktedonobacterales bacterium]|jgi:predicted RNA-binding protein YlqC (UPF0109 family)|nr:DUF4132 domain-containing protein [Ktedonobacterales bacterium]
MRDVNEPAITNGVNDINDIEGQIGALLSSYLEEFATAQQDPANRQRWWKLSPADTEAGREILQWNRAAQAMIVRQAMLAYCALDASNIEIHWTDEVWHQVTLDEHKVVERNGRRIQAARTLISTLCRRTLPFTTEDALTITDAISSLDKRYTAYAPALPLLKALRPALTDAAAMARCRPALERCRAIITEQYSSANQRALLRLLDEMLSDDSEAAPIVIPSDEWGDQANPLVAAMPAETRSAWAELLTHCATARSSTPTEKWLRAGRELRAALGVDGFAAGATELLAAFRASAYKPPTYEAHSYTLLNNGSVLDERNADLLRGLAWLCADVEHARLAAALGDGIIAGYRKITGRGPRCAKVAGACVYALQQAPNLSGVAHLERARHAVKQPQYLRGIERALDSAARAAGLAREDLEELTVPTFDLTDGRRSVVIGSMTAELSVVGTGVTLTWRDEQGKPRKAEPAEVKRERKAELKELKRLRDDLAHMLAAQSARLERLPMGERSWPLAVWRERYLDHPLVGLLARRLIWRFAWDGARADGAWRDGALVGADDLPLTLPDNTMVTPWHPVLATTAETLAWREWLERRTITQPFKQAHREVYLLTDAERATRLYSNRFAGHILRQHQFNALCAARGWRNTLRLMVDDDYLPATLELPHVNLRVEFWVEGAGDQYEVDTNATGTYWRISTDQVRFYRLHAPRHWAHAGGGGYFTERMRVGRPGAIPTPQGESLDGPVPVEEISALIFSEVMRDVDLFVGVASVGADPTWQDGGPQGRYREYWHSYSFGDLSASGEQRRGLLERLLPRLSIASRCTLDGRFLRVRGDLREYKIHLGSGNILMEPNDQYLCIVPNRSSSAANDVYLPFEGDNALAIILSKAFLLAADTTITDPTITRQIGAA